MPVTGAVQKFLYEFFWLFFERFIYINSVVLGKSIYLLPVEPLNSMEPNTVARAPSGMLISILTILSGFSFCVYPSPLQHGQAPKER